MRLKKQNGFTLTPALLILVLLMIAGVTFLIYINSIGKSERKIESSQLARNAAETGIYQLKSQLSNLNGAVPPLTKIVSQWYNAKAFDSTSAIPKYLFTSSALTEALRRDTNTSRVSDFINLVGGASNSEIIAKYRITIEDGSILPSTQTTTGSSVAGMDKYGNNIWSDAINKNTFVNNHVNRLGVKVYAEALSSNGATSTSNQSLYAVIDVPQNAKDIDASSWTQKAPSSYLLSTNGYEAAALSVNDIRLKLVGNELITGPLHTNDKLQFEWNGNFNINFTSPTYRPAQTKMNLKYSYGATRFSPVNSYDQAPPIITGIAHESGMASNQFAIYGKNLSTSYPPTGASGNFVTFFPGGLLHPSGVVATVAPASPNIEDKIIVTIPTTVSYPALTSYTNFTVGVAETGATAPQYNFGTLPTVATAILNPDPCADVPDKILGIMQVSDIPTSLGITEKIYDQVVDYNGLFYNKTVYCNDGTSITRTLPGIDWSPAGAEPPTWGFYNVTYITDKNIPHKKIKIYDKLTYSGSDPELTYIHSHKSPNKTSFPWTASHKHLGNIFGLNNVDLLDVNNDSISFYGYFGGLFDWMSDHRHPISPNLLSDTFSATDDNFFYWDNLSYKPSLDPVKIPPILAPNNLNFYKQREYANQLVNLTSGKNLVRDGSGNLQDLSTLTDDRVNGYYDFSATAGGQADFRSSYLGSDTKYKSGIGANSDKKIWNTGDPFPVIVYVNEDKTSTDYLKITDVPTIGYKLYRYFEIPKNAPSIGSDGKSLVDGGVIFIREGSILIGGATYQGTPSGTDYMYGSNIYGSNTIIDGRLAVISYSETKPVDYVSTDNPGDIIITGNVIYKNRIFPYKDQFVSSGFDFGTYLGFKQYPANLTTPPLSPAGFITNTTGTIPQLPPPPNPLQIVDSLGLFASNDIKIPVNHYHQPNPMENHFVTGIENADTVAGCPCQDELNIQAQLIAGHKIYVTKMPVGTTSKNDRLIMFGSFYSYLPPDFSYFDGGDPTKPEEDGTGRLYLFDKTLSNMPLSGSPYFPSDSSYSPTSQPITGVNLPKIIPGTWKSVPQ